MNAIALRQEASGPRASGMTFPEVERLAEGIARSGMFGMKTKEQALALMMISQAEGRHPALAARDYDVIQSRPAKKAEAMLRDFIEAGGKVEWHGLSDIIADATFSHPAGGSVRITWDMERAKTAQLLGKDMYKKYPRQMLRSRCVSEGVRTVYPAATSGMYVPEEVADFDARPTATVLPANGALVPPPAPKLIDATPAHDPSTGETGPRSIPVPVEHGKEMWVPWGKSVIAAIMASASHDEIDACRVLNAASLELCSQAAPRAHGSIEKAIAKRAAELVKPDAVEGEILSEADERALDRATERTMANGGSEPDQLADWIDERIEEANASGTLAILDEIDDQVCGELDTASRDDQRTRWNAIYAARKELLSKKRPAP